MKIFWYPTISCNNYLSKCCPYCHEYDIWKDMSKRETDSYDEKSTIKNLVEFFNVNSSCEINITGGEPHFTKVTESVLSKIHNAWVMNSNCQLVSRIQSLLKNSQRDNCLLWNASYHPFTKYKKEFRETIKMLLKYNIPVKVNYVCSFDTLPILRKSLDFIWNISKTIHVDVIKEVDLIYINPPKFDQSVQTVVNSYQGNHSINYYCGQKVDKSERPKLCNKNKISIIVGPNREIYPCITCFYSKKDILGYADKNFIMNAQKENISICSQSCWRFHQLDKIQ